MIARQHKSILASRPGQPRAGTWRRAALAMVGWLGVSDAMGCPAFGQGPAEGPAPVQFQMPFREPSVFRVQTAQPPAGDPAAKPEPPAPGPGPAGPPPAPAPGGEPNPEPPRPVPDPNGDANPPLPRQEEPPPPRPLPGSNGGAGAEGSAPGTITPPLMPEPLTEPDPDSAPAPGAGEGAPAPRAGEAAAAPKGREPLMTPSDLRGLTHFSGILTDRPVAGKAAELFDAIQDPDTELSLAVGRAKVLQLREIPERIVIGDDSIATLTFPPLDQRVELKDENERKVFTLLGMRFGTTNLTIWDKNNVPYTFLIRVTLDTRDLEFRIKTIFPGSDVKVRQLSNQIILEGQVPNTKTMTEVLQMVNGSLQVGSVVGGVGTTAFGQGGPQTAALRPQIINRVHVPGPRQIMLKVRLAELNRSAIREIGVNWLRTKNDAILGSQPGGFGGFTANSSTTQDATFTGRAFAPPSFNAGGPVAGSVTGGSRSGVDSVFNSSGGANLGSDSQLFGIFNAGQFDLFLNALRNNNLASILAEPTLMAMDGQPARFIAGGEFPFPVPQQGTGSGGSVITIQFRPFGAILTFIPHMLENDLIRLDVEPMFSQLNFGAGTSVGGTTVPGINQRSARTVVQLREGQTLALAGLLQKTINATTTRVPLLGDAPVFGTLFSRNRYETVETELVVTVTPVLMEPMEEGEAPPLPGDRVLEPNDLEFYFLGRTEGKTGHPHRASIQHHTPFSVHRHLQSENKWVIGPHGHSN